MLVVALMLSTTVTLCGGTMSMNGHATHMPFAHQLVSSCQPQDLIQWLVGFSSPLLGTTLWGWLVALAAVVLSFASLCYSSPLGLSRFDRRRRQRSPFDFRLELFAQGILNPRLPDNVLLAR